MTSHDLTQYLRLVPKILKGENLHGIFDSDKEFRRNKIFSSDLHRVNWLRSLRDLSRDALSNFSKDYVIIKFLDIPHYHAYDVDILAEHFDARENMKRALRKSGYREYAYKYSLSQNEKTSFLDSTVSGRPEIEIYAGPFWWKMQYAPLEFISKHAVKKYVAEFDLEFNVPSPTHQLYITASHCYSHGLITLGEVAYGSKLILDEAINWNHLLKLSEQYHFSEGLYTYLNLQKHVMENSYVRHKELDYAIDQLGSVLSNKIFFKLTAQYNRGLPYIMLPHVLLFSSFREATDITRVHRKFVRLHITTYLSYFLRLAKMMKEVNPPEHQKTYLA